MHAQTCTNMYRRAQTRTDGITLPITVKKSFLALKKIKQLKVNLIDLKMSKKLFKKTF